jgi:hypothetical protein
MPIIHRLALPPISKISGRRSKKHRLNIAPVPMRKNRVEWRSIVVETQGRAVKKIMIAATLAKIPSPLIVVGL